MILNYYLFYFIFFILPTPCFLPDAIIKEIQRDGEKMIFECVFSWKHWEEAVAYALRVSALRLKKHIKWLTAAEVKALDITYTDSDVSQEGWDH